MPGFWKLIIVVFLAVALGALVFFLVSLGGRVPQMPRAVITDHEQKQAEMKLFASVKGFQMASHEQVFKEKLEQIHAAETPGVSSDISGKNVKQMMKDFGLDAENLARKDRARYLKLGDLLAVGFSETLNKVLFDAQKSGLDKLIKEDNQEIKQIHKQGGAFLFHAQKSGAIDNSGRFYASKLVPEVLFRVRWRHFASIPPLDGLIEVEQKAYFDFVAVFAKPTAMKRRLSAVKQLKRLDKSYDEVVARALVLNQAGKRQEAYEVLVEAMNQGRKDAVVRDFARALDSSP